MASLRALEPITLEDSIGKYGQVRRHSSSQVSPKVSAARAGLIQDESFMRRLKQKNYGKWFMKPSEFSDKIKILNTELAKIAEMNN